MLKVLADNDVGGHREDVNNILKSGPWREYWAGLDVQILTLEDIGLAPNTPDLAVWQTCQSQGIVLFTGNRNKQRPDSLESAIRTYNQANSLPVITVGNPTRFMYERTYAERVALSLLDYLLDLDKYRGTGRLFVPKPPTC